MNKLFSKSLYIFLCAVLGALLFLIIQKSLIFIYFVLMNFDYKTFGFGITDNGLDRFGYVLTFVAIFFGGWYGTWLGLHWYKLIYDSGEGKGLIYGLRHHSIRGGFKTAEPEKDFFEEAKVTVPVRKTLSNDKPSLLVDEQETELKPFQIDALKATSADHVPVESSSENLAQQTQVPDQSKESVEPAQQDEQQAEEVSQIEQEEALQQSVAEDVAEVRAEEVADEAEQSAKPLKEIKVQTPKKVASAPAEKPLPPFLEAALKDAPVTQKRSWDFDDLAKSAVSAVEAVKGKPEPETATLEQGDVKETPSLSAEAPQAEETETKHLKSAIATPSGDVVIEYEEDDPHQPLKPKDDIGPFETTSELAEELAEELVVEAQKPKKTRSAKASAKTAAKKAPAKKAVAKKPKAVAKVSKISHRKVTKASAKKATMDGISTDGSNIGFTGKTVSAKS